MTETTEQYDAELGEIFDRTAAFVKDFAGDDLVAWLAASKLIQDCHNLGFRRGLTEIRRIEAEMREVMK